MPSDSDKTIAPFPTDGFYVQDSCCTACGVPQSIAPDLVGWTDERERLCYWKRQPETSAEVNKAIQILQTQELGCHRYAGKDPEILEQLSPNDCDALRPEMRMRPWITFGPSDIPPNFSLSASSGNQGFLKNLWRKLFRRS